MVAVVVGSFAVGFVVAVVAAMIADRTETCSTGDCTDSLLTLAVFMISLAVAPVIVMPVLGWLARFGRLFVVGSTVATVLIGLGTFGLAMGWYVVCYPLGLAVLVGTVVLVNRRPAFASGGRGGG